jgi:hypothetical protein
MDDHVHPVVEDVVGRYLELVDAALPGRVDGLYLVGSVAYGDFQPHTSDVDFVALTPSPLTGAEVAALGAVHAALHPRKRRPWFDGHYATRADLLTDPRRMTAPLPAAHEGKVRPSTPSVIEWATFAQGVVTMRGDPPRVWSVPGAAAEFSRQNVEDYWVGRWLRRQRGTRPVAAISLSAWGVAWGVLGVARMHHTVITDRIVSKSAGGHHALEAFDPRWAPIVREALRIRLRDGSRRRYANPLARRNEALAFQEHVVDEIRRLPA